MFQVRVHGRGGQGVVTAAELTAWAAIADGRHALAFPSFGSERTGAPVEAYCRIDQHPIRAREPVTEPDLVVVLDPTLLRQRFVADGLKPGATALINATGASARDFAAGLMLCGVRVFAVPATEFARQRTGRPLPNVPMLGALAAVTGIVSLEAVRDAIAQRFPGPVAEANAAAAADAYDYALREGPVAGPIQPEYPEVPGGRH
ncbi:2-oxoacid:acceptor oxidoreductase family protein [Actinocrinis puniceicyclus]|uniref:2-oxoacid:acceptor oxidoreductase family protein n=1 Tax=Actinocrinis puniceicyclus TaxID=977794 RepID=A0A8J8BDI2_9ACTN|nr:2-oxoacid:acceptor oxidoreductase family protein [Actinocrinis puniceicyclus]MBS2964176.1 2-oxoacid:acceptor oxidoreductase family protein [Actinocrinis puniceicyclus]